VVISPLPAEQRPIPSSPHRPRKERERSLPHRTSFLRRRNDQRNTRLRIFHQHQPSAPHFQKNERQGVVLTELVLLRPLRPPSHLKDSGIPAGKHSKVISNRRRLPPKTTSTRCRWCSPQPPCLCNVWCATRLRPLAHNQRLRRAVTFSVPSTSWKSQVVRPLDSLHSRCITQHVMSTSRCPVCKNALLLYCLFKLDLPVSS